MRSFRSIAWVFASVALLPLGACESGPSGPGRLELTVSAPQPVGAALVEVTGAGIRDFEGRGGTQAVGATVSAAQGRHRVVLVNATAGVLRFAIDVDDLGAEEPRVTVVSAASALNQPMLLSGFEVSIER